MKRSLYDHLWSDHVVVPETAEWPAVLYIDASCLALLQPEERAWLFTRLVETDVLIGFREPPSDRDHLDVTRWLEYRDGSVFELEGETRRRRSAMI